MQYIRYLTADGDGGERGRQTPSHRAGLAHPRDEHAALLVVTLQHAPHALVEALGHVRVARQRPEELLSNGNCIKIYG